MKLSADLIPHQDFHKGYWLKSNNCPWFFFYESPRQFLIPKDKGFYETLDEDLKNLVVKLHKKNIPTTPSCSGHIYNTNHYGKIYESLRDEKNTIQNKGIIVKNPETNKKFFYSNKNYNLPFGKQQFLEEIQDYQKKGVLGFVDNQNLYEKLMDKIPVKRDKKITMILTEGNTKNMIKKNWRDIEKLITEIIK